ncbi:F0F1 ATP synthase subunit A [Candidatus Bipolaricaulota bacterium]|nr:F0F1 ATP synthase subunit A [Candidatus Bipolaricaulota bacterium]
MSEHLGEKLILHIPVGSGGFDIDIITMIMSWIVIGLLVALALLFRRSLRQPVDAKPNRIQATLDLILQFIESQLTSNFASEKLARELFPFIGTLFLFILFSNWISIIPYFESPTKDLNVTFSFALLVFFMSQFYAVRLNGVRRYIKGFMEPYAFLLPLNVIGLVGKPLSHAFRLFGNMFGGAIMLSIIYSFTFLSFGFPLIVNLFYGLFEGAIQAFVFAILAVAYINAAVET